MRRKAMLPVIRKLFRQVCPTIDVNDIKLIVATRRKNIEQSIELVEDYDKAIGGTGIHNVSRPDGRDNLTANYDTKDSSIYRPIQYVSVYLKNESLEWFTRDIVADSCLHVESCLERYCKNSIKPFGWLLNSKEGRTLPPELWRKLDIIRTHIYNPAKHYVPDYDVHLFSPADVIAMYFICRVLGLEILRLC